jgi:hypothetical protein
MYSILEREYRDKPGSHLHYVTAREFYNIIKAAEAGHTGNPHAYRNYVIPPYRTHSMTVEPDHHPMFAINPNPIGSDLRK